MKSIKKISTLGIFVALAMIFSYIESQIPPIVPVPGIKLGLPNIVIIFTLYKIGWKEACIINLIRIILVSILFSSMLSFLYSLAGGILSLTVMILLKKLTKLSPITVSVLGGVCHNIGQVSVAVAVTSTSQIFYYLPALFISGTIAGIIIGLISSKLVIKLKDIRF